MPPRRFKKKSVRKIVEKRVAKAIEKYEKTRADSNNTGGSGSTNTGGTVVPEMHGCSYKTFMNGKPHSFKGTEGVVGLKRWFEKMEQVFEICKCAEDDKVKFAMCTFESRALTWWNGNVQTLGLANANQIPWSNVKAMMTTEYCPTTEIQRMEQELWTLTLKGDDIEAYNNRFHELVLMCPELVSTEKKKIEKYIRGFPEGIKGNVTSSKPATLHDAINMARELIEQGVQAKALRIGDSNKRKWEDQQGNNYHQQQNQRLQQRFIAKPQLMERLARNLPCALCQGTSSARVMPGVQEPETKETKLKKIEPKRTTKSTIVPETTNTTSINNSQLQAMIDQGVTAALAARDANRSTNGDDSHNSGTGARRNERATCETEIKKLEVELWELKMKGTDVIGHNQRFQELALLCGRMFPEESDKIEKYVGGLPDMIHGSVVASKPKTMQEATEMAIEVMDKRIRTFVEHQTQSKRKFEDTSRNTQNQQQQNKRQNTGRAYTARTGEKKPYGGSKPLCAKCNYHHDGLCAPKCHKCNKVGHFACDCRGTVNANNANNQRGAGSGQIPTCFECGAQGHFKRECPKLKNNNNRGNQGGNGNAPAKVYAVGRAGTDSDSNVVTGTFLLNNRYASVLFDTGADRGFVSTAFSSQVAITPTALYYYYDVELADERIIGLNTILRGCTLNLLNHAFNINLIPVELGSFDAIIGMDWFTSNYIPLDVVGESSDEFLNPIFLLGDHLGAHHSQLLKSLIHFSITSLSSLNVMAKAALSPKLSSYVSSPSAFSSNTSITCTILIWISISTISIIAVAAILALILILESIGSTSRLLASGAKRSPHVG
ncbi:reverse transcriptase domain-containing protein [Tanacetum coccineum]